MDHLEAPKPRPNPSRGENPENALFQTWKTAEASQRPEIEARLLHHLRRHAAKVCWMVLHSHQYDLVNEIAQDALMDLTKFEGRSSFSTWFHARALNTCRTKFKQIRQRREVSLELKECSLLEVGHIGGGSNSSGRASSIETGVAVEQLLSTCTPFERDLIDMKVNYGLTDGEIAEETGYTREWIQTLWSRLRKDLKDKYNGKVS